MSDYQLGQRVAISGTAEKVRDTVATRLRLDSALATYLAGKA